MNKILTAIIIALIFGACDSSEKGNTIEKKLSHSLKASENQLQAKGIVYNDLNGNQTFDKDEAGIEGVFVSNGVEIVQTNSDGEYEIPVSDDATLFIIKPRDWKTPVNEDNIPQYFYHHKQTASPENFTYKGLASSGQLPEQINFPLEKNQEENEFKIIVFGDPQPYSIEQIDFLAEDIVSELIGTEEYKFGMNMGDIVGDNLNLFPILNQAIGQIGIPWYGVMGNHDVNYMAATDDLSDDTYQRVYGPSTYAFDYANVHFIVIDDIIHDDSAGSHHYVGGMRADQLQFLENYMKLIPKDELVVMSMHIPFDVVGDYFRDADQKKIFELLSEFPNTLSISAHTHFHDNRYFHKESSDWLRDEPHHHYNTGTTSGSWWTGMRNEVDVPHTMMRDGTPNGYSIISFNGSEYRTDWKVAGSPESHKMNIHIERGIEANTTDTTLLSVNFFNGSEMSKLEYRIKGQTDWIPMKRVIDYDPYYMIIANRWESLKKIKLKEIWEADSTLQGNVFTGYYMPKPTKNKHLWQSAIDTKIPLGRHTIEVRATDRWERTFSDYHPLRVK
jgi:hypothetical protein